jgi:hypothetical protein
MPGPVILSLDLATATGWAVGEAGSAPKSGVFRIARPGTDIGPFLLAFDRWLAATIDLYKPTVIVFESPVLLDKTSIGTLRKLYSLAGLTEMIGHALNVRHVREADTGTVTKWLTGHARYKPVDGMSGRDLKKAAVMQAVQDLGFDPADDNEADALAIWLWAEATLFPDLSRKAAA